ncbi:MAG: CoA transferase [Deltaproteobacteria bacterium]|nr:CoA transferase [Deltaproteobacteria bacterium]
MDLPLKGIRVLDVTRLIPGPFCTMILGDLGADVIKVEEPTTGDYERQIGPFIGPMPYRFLLLNRNKRSLAINLKHRRGKKILLELAKGSDCLVEGFKPDTMKRLGLDYQHVKKVNRGVVYCSMSSYGHTGPSRDRNAHDLNILAESGILHMTGHPDGPPVIPGIQVVDIITALYAAIAILSALMVKKETGRGQHLDISMFDSAYTLLFDLARYVWSEQREPQRGGERLSGGLANYYIYSTKDKKTLAVGALETEYKKRLFRFLGMEGFLEEGGEITTTGVSHDKERETKEAMKEAFSQKSLEEWNEILGPANCFCSPVKTVSEALSDPHATHRGMVNEGNHPRCGSFTQLGTALKFSETPIDLQGIPAPDLGQHTVSILKEIGINSSEIEELRNRGTIFYPCDQE